MLGGVLLYLMANITGIILLFKKRILRGDHIIC